MMVCRRISTFSCSASVAGVSFGTDVEPDDDGVGSGSQQHVALVDGADGAAQHADADLVVGKLLHHVGQHFGRSADVGLQDDVELLDLAFLQLLVELFQRHAAALGHGDVARLGFAIDDDLFGLGGIGDHLEHIADLGQRIQTQHFHRHGGFGFADGSAAIVEHGADFAEHRAADEIVADAQRTVAHQHGGHRSAPAIEIGFEHVADGRTIGIGLQIQHVGHQQNHFEQKIEIGFGLWRKPAP